MNTSNTKNRVQRGFLTMSLLTCFSMFTSAQTPLLTIGTQGACADLEVLVPVHATDILNLAAITLRIGFDTTKLRYIDLVNIDPQLTGIHYSLNTTPPQIGIAWSSLIPANFSQGKFFDIKFVLQGETCPVVFNSGCELANFNLEKIPAAYIDGAVERENPSIDHQPADTSILEGNTATFSVYSADALEYSWKESKDNGSSWTGLNDEGVYSGCHSNHLTLSQVPSNFNGFRYLCSLTSGSCFTNSYSATLTVDSLSGIREYDEANVIKIKNNPNPFTDHTTFQFNLPQAGYVILSLYDFQGNFLVNLLSTEKTAGEHAVDGNFLPLTPGFYFYVLSFKNNEMNLAVPGKILKQN